MSLHWSAETREEVQRRLRAGENATRVAEDMGLRVHTVRQCARTLRDDPRPDRAAAEEPFIKPHLPSADEPLDALLDRRRQTASRVLKADEARKLIPVKLTMPGPVGLFCMGDPHLDNDGCDFNRLERDLAAIAKQPRIMALNIGDVCDGWVGRLERLYAQSSTKASDGWRLAEWLFNYPGVNWLGLVGGNHDQWSGHRDPLKWIAKARVALYENDVLRMALQHPNGEETRVHGRHNFKGQSIWNDMHGPKREAMIGHRDHLLVAGHLHLGEDGAFINPDGFVTQLVRLSGYKRADSYAISGQFQPKPMHPSALVIINPDRPGTERGRVWVAPSIEEGVDWLNVMAKRAA